MDRPRVPLVQSVEPPRPRGGGWRGRLVLVPVGQFDRRASEALEYSWQVPAQEHRALHVASDEASMWSLAQEWMQRQPGLPLSTVEDDGGVPATIARVAAFELASGFEQVVVIVGRLALGRLSHRLLHDRTSYAIARALAPIPRVFVSVMTVATT